VRRQSHHGSLAAQSLENQAVAAVQHKPGADENIRLKKVGPATLPELAISSSHFLDRQIA
jgi:hypothetical protein